MRVKEKTKEKIGLLLCILMIFSTIFANMTLAAMASEGGDIGDGESYSVDFGTGSWSIGDITVTADRQGRQELSTSDEITLTNFDSNTMAVKVSASDGFNTNLTVEGNVTSLSRRNNDGGLPTELTFSVVGIGNADGDPEPDDPESKMTVFDFTLNGHSFTNVALDGGSVLVPADFNMDTIESFYITKIVSGETTYGYAEDEYSYAMLDDQGRHIFETTYEKFGDNQASLRVLSHPEDILEKDIPEGRSREDYPAFYITNINFVKESYRAVEVSTGVMPDNYDFTVWNGAELRGTTADNPGKVTAYYGTDTIRFTGLTAVDTQGIDGIRITEISVVDDGTVPVSAVEINNETGEIRILSNFYNRIPLKIKLEDGTEGYVTVDRIGIFIGDVNAGSSRFFHGASVDVGNNLNVDTDKNRIAAVFYHENTTTYQDYDLIVNLTYSDGSTETAIAKGVGDVPNSNGDIIGSDYILWSGENNMPVSVSITAVKKGVADSNSNTFAGATFGSGSGVEWKNNR